MGRCNLREQSRLANRLDYLRWFDKLTTNGLQYFYLFVRNRIEYRAGSDPFGLAQDRLVEGRSVVVSLLPRLHHWNAASR
jgi:hypothetical protein